MFVHQFVYAFEIKTPSSHPPHIHPVKSQDYSVTSFDLGKRQEDIQNVNIQQKLEHSYWIIMEDRGKS